LDDTTFMKIVKEFQGQEFQGQEFQGCHFYRRATPPSFSRCGSSGNGNSLFPCL